MVPFLCSTVSSVPSWKPYDPYNDQSLKGSLWHRTTTVFRILLKKKKETLNIIGMNPWILDIIWTPVPPKHQYHLKELDLILREINEWRSYLGIESFKDNSMNEGFLHLSLQF